MNFDLHYLISKDGTEDDPNDGSGDDGLAKGNWFVINMMSTEYILLKAVDFFWHLVFKCFCLASTFFGKPTIGSSTECVKWRQTEDCKFDGPRSPAIDRHCDVKIERQSGYCECKDGRKTMQKGCELPSFYGFEFDTCNQACANLGDCFLCFILFNTEQKLFT